MRWILFILFCLLGTPAQAVTIPGVTTGTDAGAQTTPAPEPDLEQKKPPTGRWPMCWKMTHRARS